jgi:hypothetical protein
LGTRISSGFLGGVVFNNLILPLMSCVCGVISRTALWCFVSSFSRNLVECLYHCTLHFSILIHSML